MVLGSLGVAGDTDSRARLVEDLDDLIKETVDDLYLRAFAFAADGPVFTHDEALAIARTAVGDPQARLEPADEDRSTPVGRRVSFALKVRDEIERRKRRLGILSYDDLLSQLAEALEDPDSAARQRMRQRWQIVLVDEFQDTDPVQWQVLDRAFTGHATMVLIGDPKQAIYAFRGGDVTTYLQAAETAQTKQTLAVNWRSDAPLLDSFQRLLAGAALGDDRIVVHDVAAHHDGSRLVGAPAESPFRVRVVRREQFGRRGSGTLAVAQVRPHVARDLALDVRRLLASGATFEGEPIKPRDVAVISYRHADLADARAALQEVGVPAVIAGGGSVFATPAAVEWLSLLEALEQPHRSTRVRSAALTCFFGHTAAELDAGGDDLTDEVAETLRGWVELFATRGIAAVLESSTVGGLPARVLAEVDGERRLTDLRHIGEALHEVTLRERHGLVSLLTWLREQVAEGRAGRGTERTRRLDSDAAAVQLVTIHASKGLEYPVVYLPAVADRFVPKPTRPLFHDDADQRCVNVGGGGADWADHCRRWQDEEAGEWLRLLYVAITRAQSQVVCWWAPTKNAVASPLHRMLMRAADDAVVPAAPSVPTDDDVVDLFSTVARPRRPAARGRDPCRPRRRPAAARDARPGRPLVHPRGRHHLEAQLLLLAQQDRGGRRPRCQRPGGGQRARGHRQGRRDPRPRGRGGRAAGRTAGPDVASPMAELPVGATFGSLVHAVLEHTDPDAPDLRAELLGHIDEQLGWWPVDARPRGPGRRAGRRLRLAARSRWSATTLREIPLTDRLREMEFELPLSGGDVRGDRSPRCACGDLAPLLERHLPDGDPVRALRRAAARRPRRPAAARLPHRVGRRRAPGGLRRRPALRDRRLQDQLARPARRAADRAQLPARGARRRDGPLRLPAAGAALRRRPAPVPPLAPARLRPRRCTSAACSTSTCAACAAPRRRWSTALPAGSSRGGRRSRWSMHSPTCSTASSRGSDRALRTHQRARLAALRQRHRAARRVQRRRPAHLVRRPRRVPGRRPRQARPTRRCCWRWR